MQRIPTSRSYFCCLIWALFVIPAAWCQTLSGTIESDNPQEFSGIEIINLNNNHATVTSTSGTFVIKGQKNDVLRLITPYRNYKVKAKMRDNWTIALAKLKRQIIKQERKQQAKEDRLNRRGQHRSHRRYARVKKPQRIEINNHERYDNPFKNPVIGRVLDATGSLPGATVQIKGTTKGVHTDIEGYYGIDAKMGDVLIISFVGYRSVEIKVTHPIMNVVLEDASVTLDEVVILPYRSTRTKRITSASDLAMTPKPVPAAVEETRSAAPSTSGSSTSSMPKAGQLTATEVNDFSHYTYWQGLTENELNQWKNYWKICPTHRYSLVLKNDKGYPIVNKIVRLQSGATTVWTARTDNTGRAELWNMPETEANAVGTGLQITDESGTVLCSNPKEFHDGINSYTFQNECTSQSKINIGFMIDATGSMGDEISYLQSELYDVIERTKQQLPDATVAMSSLFYRDIGDDYVVKNFDFTAAIPNVIQFIKKQSAGGGGDYPEAVIEGLDNSIHQMSWEDDATSKLFFVVLDAPPHYSETTIKKLHLLGRQAAEKGIRIIPLAASGIDKSTEYLMRALALETNGTYLTLTNHSGIGENHITPSAESTKVEMLNELLLRVIQQFSAINHCDQEEKNFAQNTLLDEQSAKDKLVTFTYAPNPTTAMVTLRVDQPASEVFLFDTTGKLIFYRTESATEYTLDLTGLPNAVYYLKIRIGEQTRYGKIIKQNE
ncbi:carboxypeptidase-like regulatory domain-containing protein [Flavobacterium sp.]|jgi:hypothetical protein|uniref:carboxypeptidase-like regulatory domain-containing protein n=2 Tax=Flavobacterium sp. TaxID=239 RepID=UPI0022C2F6E1|nr:carboxypeptidase-like regulatory domain-containing protein [Flavobacterium sp.]MCZ8145631.1 carboxypeptidase-like regulatory domain-containing protein [Flavobacterium sp.]MCZ8367253.1 carboxypeptidase-like regulatory domain-containing protein [Flavobacterium sp.]